MKKLSLAIMALAVMGLMAMVSCRKPNVGNIPGEARTVTLNATTETGSSKTYLDGLNVMWSSGDIIYVNGKDECNKLTLSTEPGSTFGKFSSDKFSAMPPYMVGYPKPFEISQMGITFSISDNQSGNTVLSTQIPMAAYTENHDDDLAFKNMVNVLKLNLTGSQKICKIEVETAEDGDYISGDFTVGTDLTPSTITTNGGHKITLYTNITLTNDPHPVYVVLPVFSNPASTVTVKFTGENDGLTYTVSSALRGSTTPNHMYRADVDVLLEEPWEATVETINQESNHDGAVHKNSASIGGKVTGTGVEEQGVVWADVSLLGEYNMPTVANCTTYGGGKYVHNYKYATNSFTPKNTTTNNVFTGFISGLTPGHSYKVRAYIKKGRQVKYGEIVAIMTPNNEEVTGVDLGLPSGRIWASENLGKTDLNPDGDFYMWGDNAACPTTGYAHVDPSLKWYWYRFAANATTEFTKYGKTGNWYSQAGDPDGMNQLVDADDCVRQTLGGGWRMPTKADFEELMDPDNTTITWSNDLQGYTVTSKKNSNSIFLRISRNIYPDGQTGSDISCQYWSSTLTNDDPTKAYSYFSYNWDNPETPSAQESGMLRCYGLKVRPVK